MEITLNLHAQPKNYLRNGTCMGFHSISGAISPMTPHDNATSSSSHLTFEWIAPLIAPSYRSDVVVISAGVARPLYGSRDAIWIYFSPFFSVLEYTIYQSVDVIYSLLLLSFFVGIFFNGFTPVDIDSGQQPEKLDCFFFIFLSFLLTWRHCGPLGSYRKSI